MSVPHEADEPISADATPELSVAQQPGPVASPPWNLTTKAIVAFFAILLTALVIWRFRGLLQPLIAAVILAYLLLPVIGLFERRLRLSRGWSVLLVYAVVLVVWLSVAFSLGFLAIDQTNRLLRALPALSEESYDAVAAFLLSVTGNTYQVGRFAFTTPDVAQLLELAGFEERILGATTTVVRRGGPLVVNVATNVFASVGTGFIVLIASIYVARDMPRFGEFLSDLAHQPGYRSDADQLIKEFRLIWRSYLRGQIILALVIGVVVSAGLWMLGVPYALALGAVAGLLEFLPIVGPLVSTITAMIVAFFLGSTTFETMNPLVFAGIVALFMLIVQQIENGVLVPRIVGGALDLHPIVIIIAVMMGSSLAGILGAVLAAPVAATLKLFGGYGWRKMFDLAPFPDDATDQLVVIDPPPTPEPLRDSEQAEPTDR
jgi:predicted PurR-regulated permease PerM